MLPDDLFGGLHPPFVTPVPVVDVDPFQSPFATIRFNKAWLPYVLGALSSLALQTTWQTSDPAVLWLAQKRAMSLLAGVSASYPTQRPFWEIPSEIDDETLPEEPWYDTLSDWIITGFLAVTFTPQAAIVYHSTIPRMRLVFRSGDIGAFVRVLIDGVEVLYEELYSPTPQIVERVVEAVPVEGVRRTIMGTEPPYEVRIEKADESTETSLEVVLGDIRTEEAGNVLFRQLEHCPLEFSDDGGATWSTIYTAADCVTDGINDAIANDTVATPEDIADLGRATPPDTTQPDYAHLCAGVKAVVDKVEDYLDAVLADIDLSKELMAIVSDIAALTVVGDVAVNDILALVSDSTAATTAAIRAAKGANGLDELKSVLYCLGKDDGGFFRTTFEHWRSQDTAANIWKIAMIEASRAVSWAEWATVYAVAATNEDNSCEAGYDCLWCYEWNFADNDQDWTAWFALGQYFGAYVEGEGWGDNYPAQARDGIVISPPAFTSSFIHSISVFTNNAWSGPSTSMSIEQFEHGTTIINTTTNGWTEHEFVVDTTLSRFTVYGDVAAGTQQHWNGVITKIHIKGTGTNPFGESNCL